MSRVDSLEDALQEKEHKLEAAERKVEDLTARLEFTDKNRFGNKSQSINKVEPDKSDRSDKSACDRDRDGQFGNI